MVRTVLVDWLATVAPHLDYMDCIHAGVATLGALRKPQTLRCHKCFALHLCRGSFATRKHVEHTCRLCSTRFTQRPAVQANPLAVFDMQLVDGKLAISRLPNPADFPLSAITSRDAGAPRRASVAG